MDEKIHASFIRNLFVDFRLFLIYTASFSRKNHFLVRKILLMGNIPGLNNKVILKNCKNSFDSVWNHFKEWYLLSFKF